MAQPGDAGSRSAHDRAQRCAGWLTPEAPLDRTDGQGPPRVNGLSCRLSNLMPKGLACAPTVKSLVAAFAHQRSPVVLVSKAADMGLVPETALGRTFRDIRAG
ncbi:bifunctional adenosylcobinamide kinase/adenosylcobinamide-phosphate guanylyltransferase [Rhodovulum sp. ES.010]|uniref:bifunctional adenosylcobinamide kinase/adenosylcobinamide-phosphate guanylyltransferase n=1 Tax=Rhodovulum sp. ES.010 TaxID=1882821 RepID=UPI000940D562